MLHSIGNAIGWIGEHWRLAAPLAAGLCAYLLLVRGNRLGGIVLAMLALVVGWATLTKPTGDRIEGFCFAIFSGLAIASAIATIVRSNPVYAALHFSIVILSACGLFLLQAAPFLAAATIIVYAGAIIVTFLFVIMLAHQSGRSTYDLHPRQPILVGVAGLFLLAAMLGAVEDTFASHENAKVEADHAVTLKPADTVETKISPLANSTTGGVLDVGRTLFTDYLWSTELAGTILLISTIGAIAIASHQKGAAA